MRMNTKHKYYYEDGGIMDMLIDEIRNYKKALHDAINRPQGVVPESAEKLYDQNYYGNLG